MKGSQSGNPDPGFLVKRTSVGLSGRTPSLAAKVTTPNIKRGLGPVWGRFGIGLGAVWSRFGFGLEKFWRGSGEVPEEVRGR